MDTVFENSQQERAAFEKWAGELGYDLTKNADAYYWFGVENLWECWQARAALSNKKQGSENDNLRNLA